MLEAMVRLHHFWYKRTMALNPVRWPIALQHSPRLSAFQMSRHRPGPVDRYQMHGLWCVHLYRYPGELKIDGQSFPLRPGHASVTPPGARLEYIYGMDPAVHIFAHFALPDANPTASIPAMQDLGADFVRVNRALEEAVSDVPRQAGHAEAKIWDLLWQLVKRGGEPREGDDTHPAVLEAMKQIELRLAMPLSVMGLADEVGLSRNHLTRLFRATTGSSVLQYIRNRRIERAKHLLTHSTRPIKSIAAEVGIADLHRFNKTLRKMLGMPPRQVRSGAIRVAREAIPPSRGPKS